MSAATGGWALVFSGQGTQHREMLPWLLRDDALQSVERALGGDWREQLGSNADLAENHRTQLLLTGTACAAWQHLRLLLGVPSIVAGYSVGELAAFAAAGVFDATTALWLAAQRAGCMDEDPAGRGTGLLAVGDAARGGPQELCVRHGLDIAIRIDAGSAVLGGPHAPLRAAALDAQARGWRATPLNVALASHTRWMARAAEAFGQVLEGVEMRPPACPLVSNAMGRIRNADAARRALSRQIAQTVRWDDCMDEVAAQQVCAVLEIGPGQSLARMWNERFPGVPARSADEFRSARAIADWLARMQGR